MSISTLVLVTMFEIVPKHPLTTPSATSSFLVPIIHTPTATCMASSKLSFFSDDRLVLSLHCSCSWVFPVVFSINGYDCQCEEHVLCQHCACELLYWWKICAVHHKSLGFFTACRNKPPSSSLRASVFCFTRSQFRSWAKSRSSF